MKRCVHLKENDDGFRIYDKGVIIEVCAACYCIFCTGRKPILLEAK